MLTKFYSERESYSMIFWNWNKVNSYISALKPLPRVPIAQKGPNFGTFGYLRHFGSSGLLKKFKILICDFLTLKGNEGRRLPDTPLSPPTPSNNPKTPLKTPKHPQAPETHSPVPQEQPWPLPSTIQTV